MNLFLNKIICTPWERALPSIDDQSIDLLLTDPPYGMQFVSGHRKVKHDAIANDDNLDWLPSWLQEIKRVMKEDAHGYIFVSHHFYYKFMVEIVAAGLPVKNTLVWMKNNTGMGDLEGDYAPQYELIIFLSNGEKKLNGRRDSNILRFARTMNALHPTQKPTDLFRYLIMKSSKPGEVVLDTFGGSCTTAEAATIEGRSFIVFEMEDKYVKTGNDRLERLRNAPGLFDAAA